MATVEGWKNYETWCVNLWLDNDERLYREVRDRAQALARNTDPEDAKSTMSEWLKDYVGELQPTLGGMWADLLTSALGEVDWAEIAGQKIDEAIEEAA